MFNRARTITNEGKIMKRNSFIRFQRNISSRYLASMVLVFVSLSGAFAQTASIAPTPTSVTEANLNSTSLTLTLTSETFIDYTSLPVDSFALVGAPAGTSIASVTGVNASTATIDLDFNFTDFDTDHALSIDIRAGVLTVTASGVLRSSTITVQALQETASLSASPDLSEYNLNNRVVSIQLTQETFSNPGALVAGNFTRVNAPPGVTIQSISGTPTATHVDLVLAFNGADFDVDYADFRISINHAVLTQSNQNLVTTPITIYYELEPVVTGVSIPNDTMRVGDEITATITVLDDEGNDFSLGGGVIGGYTLGNLMRVDQFTYTATFTIVNGGVDYAASQDIPVVNVQLMNETIEGDPIPGNVYSGSISQANDPLDANRPVIRFVYTSLSGPQNIGSEILLWIRTDENGLSFSPASTVNSIPISSPSISITASGDRLYRLRYVVSAGDNNVAPGALAVSMIAVDHVGNQSTPPFTAIDPNTLSIDASRPVIQSASITSTDNDIIVGETVEIVVVADQAGYRNDNANTWINGVFVEPGHLVFTPLGDGSYHYAYTVQELDGSVERGELTINIVLLDASPYSNASLAFTDLASNEVQIVTDRPSATISGPPQICYGDSARISVVLGGTPPWTLDISNGITTTIHSNILTSPYTYYVHPLVSTNYTVTRVVDGTGNENVGSGVASITVNALPAVQIQNLQGMYDVSSQPVELEYTPLGGTFTGPGISGPNPWTFSPGVAGVSPEGSPHEIR